MDKALTPSRHPSRSRPGLLLEKIYSEFARSENAVKNAFGFGLLNLTGNEEEGRGNLLAKGTGTQY